MEDYETDHALAIQAYEDNMRDKVQWILGMADLRKPVGKTVDQKRECNWKYLKEINEIEKRHARPDCRINFDKVREDLPFPEVA